MTDGHQREGTLEEVQVAMEDLIRDEDALLKLRHVATRCCAGSSHRPEDLVQEAFTAALELRRRWNLAYSFFSFICGAMRSIAWDDRTSLPRRRERPFSAVGNTGDLPDDEVLDNADVRVQVQNRMANAAEEAAHAHHRQHVDAVFALFANDDQITLILMAMEDGLRGADIEQQCGLSPTEHANARRRMKRRLAAAYPERRLG